MHFVTNLFARGAMSIKDFCQWASIDQTTAEEEIMFRRLKVRKVGEHTLVSVADAQEWLDSLPTQQRLIDEPHLMIHYGAVGS